MGRTYWQSASQTATRTKVAQGTDGSPLYVKNNAGNFILAHANSGTVVSFKAFLSEFNMKISYALFLLDVATPTKALAILVYV